jgi:hypothetical protein
VPPGAACPALGTNPIAFGFPSAEGPVIFDIGTSSLMWGEVLLAAETGEALPPGVAFDADGNPTQDGRAAARGGVAAFGGHKGYGLACPDMVLSHGGSPCDAERIAACWADNHKVPQIVFEPDWTRHRNAAPQKRNDKMLEALPLGVVVFPGSGIAANLAERRESWAFRWGASMGTAPLRRFYPQSRSSSRAAVCRDWRSRCGSPYPRADRIPGRHRAHAHGLPRIELTTAATSRQVVWRARR